MTKPHWTDQKNYDRDRHYRIKYGERMMEQFGVQGIEGFHYLLEHQKECCALCGVHVNEFDNRGMPSLVHDHCHETGYIRGLVCIPCNTLLGGYEKAVNVIGEKKIRSYIQSFKTIPSSVGKLPI